MGTGQSGKFKGKKVRLLKFSLSSFTYSFLPPNSHLSPSRALHHLLTLDTSPRSHTAIITRLPALTAYHHLSSFLLHRLIILTPCFGSVFWPPGNVGKFDVR